MNNRNTYLPDIFAKTIFDICFNGVILNYIETVLTNFKQKTMDFLLDMIDKDKRDKGKDKKDGKKSKDQKTRDKEAENWGRKPDVKLIVPVLRMILNR